MRSYKRIKIAAVSFILCLALLLASCGGGTENTADTTATYAVTSSKTSMTASETALTTAEVTTTQMAPAPTLPDIRESMPVKGLYKLTEEKGSMYAPDFCTYGDLLIYRYENNVKLIDITNGNVLTSAEEDEEYLRLGLTDHGYYFIKGNTVELFGISGEKISDTALPADELWTAYVSPDMKYILYSANNGTFILDLSKGEYAKTDIELYVSVVSEYSGGRFTITDFNSDLYYLYTDGRTEKLKKRKNSYDVGGVLFETNYEGIAVSKTGSGIAKILYGDFEDKYVSAADERFFIASDFKNFYRIYDAEKNCSTDSIDLGESNDVKACGGGAFVILEYQSENRYEFYVLFSSETEFPFEYETKDGYEFPENYVQVFKEPEGDEETLELIEYIYDRYHVRVFFELKENQSGQLFEYYFKDFTGDKKKMLKELLEFMKLSPDDIWRQVRDGNDCYIYFCDAINEGPDAAVDAAGLTLEIGENPTITLQDEGSVTIDLFSHEFIHLLEKKVYYELLNDWEKLSPDGSYFMSYENYMDRKDAFDYTCYGNKGKVYFIDSYSRTFPTEDRARVGEYLYSSYKEGKLVWQFKENKYIRKKAVKLCEILRETYPCLDSVPKGEWYLEKYLDIK